MTSLIVGLLVIRLAGRVQPQTVAAQFLSTPGGAVCARPCLFGIYPGETSLDNAVVIMSKHPLTRHMTTFHIPGTPNVRFIDNVTTIDLLVDQEKVMTVDIKFQLHFSLGGDPAAQITLGDIVLVTGEPFRTQHLQTALMTGDIFQTYFNDGQFSMSTWLTSGNYKERIKTSDPVFTLSVTTKDRFNPPFQWSPWHGFSALERYSESTTHYEGEN